MQRIPSHLSVNPNPGDLDAPASLSPDHDEARRRAPKAITRKVGARADCDPARADSNWTTAGPHVEGAPGATC
eukprot:6369271-Alexandrium_andersonii.AAC.1